MTTPTTTVTESMDVALDEAMDWATDTPGSNGTYQGLAHLAAAAWAGAPGAEDAAPSEWRANTRRSQATELLYNVARERYATAVRNASPDDLARLDNGDTTWLRGTYTNIAAALYTAATALGTAFWGEPK